MEENKRLQRENFTSAVVLRSISLYASRGLLWSRVGNGKCIELDAGTFIPVLKICNNFKPSLLKLVKDTDYTLDVERYIKGTGDPLNSRELELQEIQFLSRIKKNEVLIKLIHSEGIEREVFEAVLSGIMNKIDSFEEYLSHNDICVTLIQYYMYKNSLRTYFHLIYPEVNFVYQPINTIKIVSTPLSMNLIKKEDYTYKFQTGYLTMDQKRRILPLKVKDKNILKYPLVGVWATGIKKNIHHNPYIWSSFIRFIESQAIRERISPCPSSNTFLYVYFSPKPLFYEISTQGKSSWKLISKTLKPNSSEIKFIGDDSSYLRHETPNSPSSMHTNGGEKKSMTASTSLSEGRYSRVQSSFESDATEKMILKHNLMLRNLEKQINDLQNILTEPKYVNAETNTTSFFSKGKDSAMRFSNRRQSAGIRESRDSIPISNPLRSSCNLELRSTRSDATITVPKIIYKPDSDSDEDSDNRINYIA